MDKRDILLVDALTIVRCGMKFILESNFNRCNIDEAEDGSGLILLLSQKHYSHLILDLQLQDYNVINLFGNIRQRHPDLLVMIYTMYHEEVYGKRLMQMGAMGVLSKQSSEEEIVKALNLFLLGRKYFSAKMVELMKKGSSETHVGQNPFDQLSDREFAVVHNLLRGRGVKEIAEELDIKSTTVATYKSRVFDKIGVNNMMDLRNMARIFHFSE